MEHNSSSRKQQQQQQQQKLQKSEIFENKSDEQVSQ
jgi:hypothetical protein